MTESPDLPWARDDDGRGPPPAFSKPLPPLQSLFLDFLFAKNIKSARVLVIGPPDTAIHFAHAGFDVHFMAESRSGIQDLDLYGVQVYEQGIRDHWLFEDGFFDLVISSESLLEQIRRVLRPGGYCLLESECAKFPGFRLISSHRIHAGICHILQAGQG